MLYNDYVVTEEDDMIVIYNTFIMFSDIIPIDENTSKIDEVGTDKIEVATLNKSDFLKLKEAINDFELD